MAKKTIVKGIIEGLEKFTDDLVRGVPLQEFLSTRMTTGDLRNYLHQKGWHLQQVNQKGKGRRSERWRPPWSEFGSVGFPLRKAVQLQLKADGYILSKKSEN